MIISIKPSTKVSPALILQVSNGFKPIFLDLSDRYEYLTLIVNNRFIPRLRCYSLQKQYRVPYQKLLH